MFEVFKTQEIEFSALVNIISGDADLYIKKCDDLENCKFNESQLDDENVLKM